MLFGETEVRANIRNRDGKRVFYLGKGDQLTSGARDFLSRERIPILPAHQAKPERFRLMSGGFVEQKGEHLTHLNGDVLVPKTHPRIAFRGAMDTLEAEMLLCQLVLGEPWRKQVGEILEFARVLLRCEVLGEPVKQERLCGLTAGEIRERSHRPQDFYGQAHFMPSVEDGEAILRLNRVRCAARHAELMAVAAFQDREGNPTRVDLLQAMNRMSSMIWIMMIQLKRDNKL
jgi:ethanolamine utilization cobalamin adenosyltransferase